MSSTPRDFPEPVEKLDVNYHALLANSPDTMLLLDLDSERILAANAPATALLGIPEAQLRGMPLMALCPPLQPDGQASGAALHAGVARVLDGGASAFEVRLRHADGSRIDCELRPARLPAPGRLLHVRVHDITRRKLDDILRSGQAKVLEMIARGARLEDTLDTLMLLIETQSEGLYCSIMLLNDDGATMRPVSSPSLPAAYTKLLEGLPIGPTMGSCGTAMYLQRPVVVSDIMSDPLWAPYTGLVKPFGLRACWSTPIALGEGKLIGSFAMYYREVRSPAEDDLRLTAVATHLAGIAIERTRRERELLQHREHLEELVAARTGELSLANEELAATLEDLKAAQEELVRRDKLAALGSLVTGIAHELNTPIGNSLVVATTMSDHTETLAEQIAEGLRRSALETYLDEARQANAILVRNLQRAASLVSSFKQIGVDHSSAERHEFSLARLVREQSLPLCVVTKARGVSFEQDIAPDLVLDSYPGPLAQVVGSIFDNCAAHAFADERGGNIRVRAEVRGAAVHLAISDDGVGIAPAHLSRVYDPFFTTRLGAGGSGLGLHIAHNIVTGVLGGRIDLHSKLGLGSTFTLVLPLHAPQAQAAPVQIAVA